jgi:DNA uptake protein ComE-like DNA-binding protein
MAPRAKKTADSPDSWLIDGAAAPSKSAGKDDAEDFESLAPAPRQDRPSPDASDEAKEWLVVPEPSSTPVAEPKKKGRRRPAKQKKQEDAPSADGAEQVIEDQRAEIAALSAQVRTLEGELKTQDKRSKSQESREAELGKRIEELEAEVAESKTRATVRRARRSKATGTGTAKRKTATTKAKATRSKAGGSKAKAPASKAASTTTKGRKNGKLDLNEATFEELRELGLSVTQSARLIAYRDVRGGYESLDEIDDVPGLSEQTRGELKGQLKLGT